MWYKRVVIIAIGIGSALIFFGQACFNSNTLSSTDGEKPSVIYQNNGGGGNGDFYGGKPERIVNDITVALWTIRKSTVWRSRILGDIRHIGRGADETVDDTAQSEISSLPGSSAARKSNGSEYPLCDEIDEKTCEATTDGTGFKEIVFSFCRSRHSRLVIKEGWERLEFLNPQCSFEKPEEDELKLTYDITAENKHTKATITTQTTNVKTYQNGDSEGFAGGETFRILGDNSFEYKILGRQTLIDRKKGRRHDLDWSEDTPEEAPLRITKNESTYAINQGIMRIQLNYKKETVALGFQDLFFDPRTCCHPQRGTIDYELIDSPESGLAKVEVLGCGWYRVTIDSIPTDVLRKDECRLSELNRSSESKQDPLVFDPVDLE